MSTMPRHRTVGDVMTARVHVATPVTPFKILVRLIEENKVSAIPIVDQQGIPLGIVSEADLLLKERRQELEGATNLLHFRRQARDRAKAEGMVASALMTSPPLSIAADATLTEAARLMQERNVRRLIVVDKNGRIAGIVSRSDLLQVFLRNDEDLREEIVTNVVPSIILDQPEDVGVEVSYNVVTLHGEVDRKSDSEILERLISEVDGVVQGAQRDVIPVGRLQGAAVSKSSRQQPAPSNLNRMQIANVGIATTTATGAAPWCRLD